MSSLRRTAALMFGLSLAAYNAIFAFLIAGIGFLLLRRNHGA